MGQGRSYRQQAKGTVEEGGGGGEGARFAERYKKVHGARWLELPVTHNSCPHLPHTLQTHPTPLCSPLFPDCPPCTPLTS